jgi:hypothetical protein
MLIDARQYQVLNRLFLKTTFGAIKSPWHLLIFQGGQTMPWDNGDYPPSYKNQPKKIREKATEIANEVLKTTGNEGEAIATGLKQARAHFANYKNDKAKDGE